MLDGIVQAITEQTFPTKDLQHRNTFHIFHKQAYHVRQVILIFFLFINPFSDSSEQPEQCQRKYSNHHKTHAPINTKQADAEYQRHNEVGGHPCP